MVADNESFTSILCACYIKTDYIDYISKEIIVMARQTRPRPSNRTQSGEKKINRPLYIVKFPSFNTFHNV
ncbi:hypothetical protein RclHR1_07970001 [Rhizophagus clarus]|uniref:Uncharacterized protein n=1 Tax=Rhizophagus clarus TaxID=94130 RepID=A0A2Z6SMK9_9GLOM|nr:hypothetical protein RclHR1_07970001 [Rhizophagus clarus]